MSSARNPLKKELSVAGRNQGRDSRSTAQAAGAQPDARYDKSEHTLIRTVLVVLVLLVLLVGALLINFYCYLLSSLL